MILTDEQLHQISEKYWRPMGTLATSEVRDMFDTVTDLQAQLAASREELDSLKQQWNALQDYIHKTDFETRPAEKQAERAAVLEHVVDRIASFTGPHGGWTDGPKQFHAAILALETSTDRSALDRYVEDAIEAAYGDAQNQLAAWFKKEGTRPTAVPAFFYNRKIRAVPAAPEAAREDRERRILLEEAEKWNNNAGVTRLDSISEWAIFRLNQLRAVPAEGEK